MGLSGFLKFLKDLNLMKPNQVRSSDSETLEASQATNSMTQTIYDVDISGLSKIELHRAELLFTSFSQSESGPF